MESSTPNEKTEREEAKEALSDYINSIRVKKILSYLHDPHFVAIDNNTSVKVTKTTMDGSYKSFIWDTSIQRYTVTGDASTGISTKIGFASYDSDIYCMEHNDDTDDEEEVFSCAHGWY
jgi:hypothetical protein